MGAFFDSNIPNDAHTFITSCMGGPGVSVVAFTPSGGWVVVAPNGSYYAEGIPQELLHHTGKLHQQWLDRTIHRLPALRRGQLGHRRRPGLFRQQHTERLLPDDRRFLQWWFENLLRRLPTLW